MLLGERLLIFQRNVVPSSSGSRHIKNDEDTMFLQNIGNYSPNITVSHSIRPEYQGKNCENLRSDKRWKSLDSILPNGLGVVMVL